jgi:anti-sigma regulatory factor (Ser/Thr protein kinase)
MTGPDLPRDSQSPYDAGGRFAGAPRERKPAPTLGGAHRLYLAVPAQPDRVPYIRHCTTQTLNAWRLGNLAPDAELVVSELLTNAVRATQTAASPLMLGPQPVVPVVVLYLATDADWLWVLVWDCCPESPQCRGHGSGADGDREPDPDSENGRGLEIVDAVSDRWGTCSAAGVGKVVWAQLGLPTRPE